MAKTFNPFRYFIVPTSDQGHLDYYMGRYTIDNKSDIVKDYLIGNFEKKKTHFTYRNSEYLLCYNKNYNNRFLVLKFGKRRVRETYEEGEFDIEDKELKEYPYIYMLVDLQKQILLVEHLSKIFDTTHIPAKAFVTYLSIETNKYKYKVNVNPMLIESSFWQAVRVSECVKELQMKLESPNLFDGVIDINEFLGKQKNIYNNTNMEIKLKNKEEQLKIEESNQELKSAVEYIENGGGSWKMQVVSEGMNKSISSIENKQIIRVDDEIEEYLLNEESDEEEIRRIFDSVYDILKDDGNE